jgi:WhiB family transcriptional regulator, redox-sensing transcriptional regulator
MTGAGAGTYREIVLAHLASHPALTAYELERATGAKGSLLSLLRAMERQALVVAAPARRPGQGHPVSVWRIAPAGTVPGPADPESPEQIADRRARQRAYQRKRTLHRAHAVPVPFLPPGAACARADTQIFFPGAGADKTEAMAFCAPCPVRAACHDRAEANGERHGIWGGVNFDDSSPSQRRRAS